MQSIWEKRIVAMIQHLSFTLFTFFAFATQLFSTPVTSLNFRNQAPLFMELRLLQATHLFSCYFKNYNNISFNYSWHIVLHLEHFVNS